MLHEVGGVAPKGARTVVDARHARHDVACVVRILVLALTARGPNVVDHAVLVKR